MTEFLNSPVTQEILLGAGIIVLIVLALSLALIITRRVLIPTEALQVTVNGTEIISANRGDRLLGVLHGAGIGIPAACGGSGTCGLCRVQVTGEGAGEPQATEKGVLSAAERREDTRLACQTILRGPCAVTVASEFVGSMGFTCRVLSNVMKAPLIRELTLALPEGHDFSYRAGDFMQLTAPAYDLDFSRIEIEDAFQEEWRLAGWRDLSCAFRSKTTRAYSVACRPEDAAAGRAVFNIRLAVPPAGKEKELPPGRVSSWLFSLGPGDEVQASGPFGDFHVQDTAREKIFIGGGVGMAPMRAMIHQELAKGTDVPMHFYYGARTAGDLYYVEEFNALAEAHENFSWVPALSDPAPGDRWTGARGFIHDTVRRYLAKHPRPEDCEYYLCGPPVMISAVMSMLAQFGVEPAMIHNDDFGV
ncbi:MAG TPA: NADH:ubiquinone reductase (Na(+)-transporting) subunit F [Maritimibacter sp.]|nr:NADH:ubiquinone reductase (Na(+)-transporting) subunit F [Maritimibacter sp.]